MKQPDILDRFLTAYSRRGWRGFLTLRRWLRRPTILVRSRYGAVVRLHPEDHIDRIVLDEGYYESEVFESLRPFFAPGVVLWDIGGNFGLHSLSAALAEPAMQVHAFEPSPAMHARLSAHATLNHTGLRCWPLALGESDGSATLHINAAGNPGMTTLTPWSEARYDQQVQVPLGRADTLVARGQVPAPNLIKLDVEGAEAAVLRGCGDLLARPELRAVVFEAPAQLLDDPACSEPAQLLRAAGFELRALVRHEDSRHLLGNFIAVRPA